MNLLLFLLAKIKFLTNPDQPKMKTGAGVCSEFEHTNRPIEDFIPNWTRNLEFTSV